MHFKRIKEEKKTVGAQTFDRVESINEVVLSVKIQINIVVYNMFDSLCVCVYAIEIKPLELLNHLIAAQRCFRAVCI